MFKKCKKYYDTLVKKAQEPVIKTIFDKINDLFDSLEDDVLCINVGDDFINFAEDIRISIEEERINIKDKTGFIFPPVRYKNNSELQENEYEVLLNGKVLINEFVIPNRENISSEIKSVLKNVYENYLNEIFSNEITEKYINHVKENNSKLTADVCYNLSTVEIKYILKDLLKNNKSINNISLIFEKISEQIFIENSYEKYNPHKISKEIIKTI